MMIKLKIKSSVKSGSLIYMIFFVAVLAYSQRSYHYKDFADVEKLSNSVVADIFQDSYGFLWIATGDGVNRYDSKHIKIYKNNPENEFSLPDNATFQVFEDKNNNIWVGHYDGISRLDRRTERFKRFGLENLPFKNPPTFYAALSDTQGRIWISSSQLGVLRFNEEKEAFERILLSKENNDEVWGEVHEIIELSNGVILAADFSNGLKKYNPSTDRFDPYFLKPGFSPREISVILESGNGNIWYGGKNTLIRYSSTQYHFVEFDLLQYSNIKTKYNQILSIVEDDEGYLWIGVNDHGIFRINSNLTDIEHYSYNASSDNSIIENSVAGLLMDKYGIIWVTFLNGGIGQFDPNVISFSSHPLQVAKDNFDSQTAISVLRGMSGSTDLVIGTRSEGMLQYNLKHKKTKRINLPFSASTENNRGNIQSITIDPDGHIWFAERNSDLKRIDRKTGKIRVIESPHKGKTSVIAPISIRTINSDLSGNIWIASNYGVDKYDPKTNQYFTVPRIMNREIAPDLKSKVFGILNTRSPLSAILKVEEGANVEEKFILSENSKTLVISAGEGRSVVGMFDYGSLLTQDDEIIWKMGEIENTYYAGGGFKNRIAFQTFDLPAGEYKLNYKSDVGHSYGNWNTLAPADSNLWGVQVFKINADEFNALNELIDNNSDSRTYLPFEIGRVVEVSKKYSNTVWIGSFTNSFFKYDLSNGAFEQYSFNENTLSTASHYINSIYEDLDGIVWVGTYASLIRLEPETGKLNTYTTEDGLPGGIIQSLIEDDFGGLWIHSSGGLSKLNKNAPLDEFNFVNFDSRDGFDKITENAAVWKGDDGRIYYGAKGNIISFLPGSINSLEPDIVIFDFKVDDVSASVDSMNIVFDGTLYNTGSIELSHAQNDIAFEFAAIHFSRPDKNKLSYTLEGFSRKWYESERNFASFTNLDPGRYTFKVKGANADGIWNEKGRSIHITILSPWWKTGWAYASYVILFLFFLFTIRKIELQRQFKNSRIKESELKAKAAEAQNRAIQAENQRKTQELEDARKLQLSMLPRQVPQFDNLDIAVYMKTATEVGGDYYDFSANDNGTLNIAIGDATGHGMKAGTLVASMKSLFTANSGVLEIDQFFNTSNAVLKKMQLERVMMGLAMLQVNKGSIRLINAGMPPVFHYRKKTNSVEEIDVNSMPLGAMERSDFEMKDIKTDAGDCLLMMSDGMPELRNGKDEMFGYKRIENALAETGNKSSQEIINHLLSLGLEWQGEKDPEDDVTFVVVKLKGKKNGT